MYVAMVYRREGGGGVCVSLLVWFYLLHLMAAFPPFFQFWNHAQMDLTVFRFDAEDGTKKTRRLKIERAVCTGGDLIRLRCRKTSFVPHAAFDADCVLTGIRAEPYVQTYFSSVLQRLGRREDESKVEVGAALPDCAVVLGAMRLTAPIKFLGDSFNKDALGGGDSSGWMSD